MSETKIIEIEGVKLEVDLRKAKRIDRFKVGDKVKLLITTKGYGNKPDHEVYPGVIVGFENFEKLPTIVIAYLEMKWDEAELKFFYLNKDTEDAEIAATYDDYLPVQKDDVIKRLDREIVKKETELEELNKKKHYFLNNFDKYFEMQKGE